MALENKEVVGDVLVGLVVRILVLVVSSPAGFPHGALAPNER